jgi:hypothetical protein
MSAAWSPRADESSRCEREKGRGVFGIHYRALKLQRRQAKFHREPPLPAQLVSR